MAKKDGITRAFKLEDVVRDRVPSATGRVCGLLTIEALAGGHIVTEGDLKRLSEASGDEELVHVLNDVAGRSGMLKPPACKLLDNDGRITQEAGLALQDPLEYSRQAVSFAGGDFEVIEKKDTKFRGWVVEGVVTNPGTGEEVRHGVAVLSSMPPVIYDAAEPSRATPVSSLQELADYVCKRFGGHSEAPTVGPLFQEAKKVGRRGKS